MRLLLEEPDRSDQTISLKLKSPHTSSKWVYSQRLENSWHKDVTLLSSECDGLR